MFACERGTGDLVSPNAAAATPRWAVDAPRLSRRSETVTGGEFSSLRSDVARKSPLEALYAFRDLLTGGDRSANSKRTGTNGSTKPIDDSESVDDVSGADSEGVDHATMVSPRASDTKGVDS